MNMMPEKSVSVVMKAFKKFYNKNLAAEQVFDTEAFMEFMEPKFAKAGYRKKFNPRLPEMNNHGNILIVTDLGVGNFVVTTGVIREVRRIYPGAHITLLSHKTATGFAEICPHVDEVIIYGKYSAKFPSLFRVSMEIASKLLWRRFDIAFCFTIHTHADIIAYMSGAQNRFTPIFWRNFNKMVSDTNTSPSSPKLKKLATKTSVYGGPNCRMPNRYFLILEEILHVPILNRKLEVWYTPKDFSVARTSLGNVSGPLYSLCMGGKLGRKHYPPEKYARLLEMIAEEDPTARFVILGGGDKDLQSAEIFKATAPELYEKKVVDLTNKLSYRESAAVLSLCNMSISNDTGMSHVAAGIGCPVLSPNCFPASITMWPIHAPARLAPYGVPCVIVQPKQALPECSTKPVDDYGCKLKTTPHCITQIAPETLFEGFHLLKERAERKIDEPLYIS